MTATHERYSGCAAFHPNDDNIVYMFGGLDYKGTKLKSAFKYQIDTETHYDLKDMNYELAYHACMGFVKDGRPVSSKF